MLRKMNFKIDLKIFFFLVIFYFTKQISIYSYMMIFAILHECGHLLIGIAVGFKPESICCTPLGFSVKFRIMEEEYNNKVYKSNMVEVKKILIAIAGPATNFILIFLFSNINCNFLDNEIIIYSNLLIAIFNLMPIYPLDGGRILSSMLNLCWGRKKAYTYIQVITNIFMIILTFAGSILVYYFKNIAVFLIVIYLWGIVVRENKFGDRYYNLGTDIKF